MREIISFLIAALSLYIYLILSSIEFGLSIFVAFPKLLDDSKAVKKYLSPVWETTNVFLVFFLVAIMTVFPGAIYMLGTNLLPVIFTAFAIFAIRIVFMLFIFYTDRVSKMINGLLLLSSFIAPMIFSLCYIYFLTGSWTDFILSPLYLGLVGIVACTIILLAATFFSFYANEQKVALARVIKISFGTFVVFLTIFIIALSKQVPYLFRNANITITFYDLLILCLLAFAYLIQKKYGLWQFLNFCLIIAVLFLGLAIMHLPYIVFPSITIYNSFTNRASFGWMAISFIVGTVLLIPSLFLLYWLFTYSDQKRNLEK